MSEVPGSGVAGSGEPLDLRGAIEATLAGALLDGHPVDVAYVDEDGKPHLSMRGTVQVFGPTQLALWARSGGLPEGIARNPNVALLYQNVGSRLYYSFTGRAHVDTDDEVRRRVFEGSPEREQGIDPERNGVAIVIDVDSVSGRGPDGRIAMAR